MIEKHVCIFFHYPFDEMINHLIQTTLLRTSLYSRLYPTRAPIASTRLTATTGARFPMKSDIKPWIVPPDTQAKKDTRIKGCTGTNSMDMPDVWFKSEWFLSLITLHQSCGNKIFFSWSTKCNMFAVLTSPLWIKLHHGCTLCNWYLLPNGKRRCGEVWAADNTSLYICTCHLWGCSDKTNV